MCLPQGNVAPPNEEWTHVPHDIISLFHAMKWGGGWMPGSCTRSEGPGCLGPGQG